MKRIVTILLFVIFSGKMFGQVPSNDVCTGSIALPALGTPALCTSTTQAPIQTAWTAVVHGTNTNANPAPSTPATCPPPDAPNDVWYSVVLKGTNLYVKFSNVTGLSNVRINLWSSPTNGGCNAADFALNSCKVINGGNGTVNFNNAMVEGTTYYLQVSGNDGSEYGSFDISVRGERTCGSCVQQGTLTSNPAPVNGYYLPGQVVKFKLVVKDYHQISTNWFHGVAIENIGNGWATNSIAAVTTPGSCAGNGRWRWYTSVFSNNTGKTYGPGFFYDEKDWLGNYDNNPGNNYGDNCTNHTWTFEWSLTVRGCPFTPNANSLTFTVNTLGDGESGGWSNNDCYNDVDYSFQAYYQPFPPPTLTETDAGCTPTGSVSAIINGGSPNYTYLWSTGATGSTNGAVPIVLGGIPAAVYTLKITDANNCVSNSSIRVNANTTPPIANAGGNQVLSCAVPSVKIGTAAIAGFTYAWLPAAGLSNPAIAQPTTSTPNNYTLTVTNTANGCTATDAVSITSTGTTPIANAGPDKTLTCTNTSFQIGAAAVAGNTYSWSPSAGLSNAGIAQPTVTAPNTYYLTVTNTSTGCSVKDTVVITKNITAPTANAGADKVLTCTNPTQQIGTIDISGNTYAWSPATGLSNAGIAQPNATKTGTYTVTVTNTANGCTATNDVNVTIDTIRPTADAGLDKTITCTNPNPKIGTAAIAGNTYAWLPTTGLSNTAIAQPNTTSTGNFTVTVTKTSNGCTNTDNVVVNVDTIRPTANAGANKTLTCTNTTFQIGTATVVGNTYAWSPIVGLSDPTIAQPIANKPNTYILTVTKTANGCKNTANVIVAIDTTIPVANAGRDSLLTCITTQITIGTTAIAGNTYSWSPSVGLSVDNIAKPIASAPNTYTLTVTHTANGCKNSDAVKISQNIAPPTANAGADKIITCSNPAPKIGTAAIAGNTYSWLPIAGLSDPSIAQPNVTSIGTYTVTVTKTVNGCTATDDVLVSVDTTRPNANAGANKILTCTNSALQIGTASVAGNTYAWSPAIGLSDPAIAQPTANKPNTYTLIVTKTVNGCTSSDNVAVAIDTTTPAANAGRDSILTCTTTQITIGTNATAGNTYAWSPSAGLSVDNIAKPIASAPNTYTLTVTHTANGCTNSDAVKISQNITPPTANAGADKTLTCSNPSQQIGTPAIAGNTYSWLPTAGLSDPTIAQPIASSTGTYTVTVTNTINGCTATDDVVVGVDTIKPTANAGANKTLTCAISSIQIGTTAIAGNTYNWSPSAGLSNAGIAQPNATKTGTYIVTVTQTANGCTNTSNVTVAIDTVRPRADAGVNKTLTCANPSQQIGTAAIAGNTYAWSPIAGLSDPSVAQPTTNTLNNYTVTVTKTSNGCTNSDAVIISQDKTAPIADAGVDKTLTCTISSQQIGTTAIAGNTYAWSPSAGLSNAGIAQPNANKTGTYTVTVTNTANGCSASNHVNVLIDTIKPVTNAGADMTLTCSNPTRQIGTAAIAGNTYAWLPTAGLSDPTIAQPIASTTGTFTITVTKTTNGCTATDDVVVGVDTIKPSAIAGANKTLTCAISSIQIGTTAIPGNTYNWSPSAGLSNAGIAQPNATKTGTYILTVTQTANGCTNTSNVAVAIDTVRPRADAGVNKTLTCANPSQQIGTAAIAGNTYAWSPIVGLSDPNIAQPITNALQNYTVTVTKSSNGCTNSDEVIIFQNITTASAVAGENKTLTCVKHSFEIGAPAISGNAYSWSPAVGLSNAAIAQPTANKPGKYTLTVTNLANGCTSTDVTEIKIDTISPITNAGVDRILNCVTKNSTIGTTAIAGYSYTWTPITGLSNPAIAQPTASTNGTFTVTVVKDATGCSAKDAVNVGIDTLRPTANAGIDQYFDCPHRKLVIGTSSEPNLSYKWTNVLGLDDYTIAQPSSDSSGVFVLVTTNTINHCKSAPDSVVLYPKNCTCEFYVPTAFSPNNDGINDVLAPFKDCDDYRDLSFSVFNRWGELVFKSDNILDGWNGFYKNESQQVDSYVWILEYFDILHNEKRKEKGIVSLLK